MSKMREMWRRWGGWLAAAAVLTAYFAWSQSRGALATDALGEVKSALDDGAPLVDVRTPQEFDQGHVEGAINVPLHLLPQQLDRLGPRDRPVVLYCRSGNRSDQAAHLMRQRGFTRVHDMGAMHNWARLQALGARVLTPGHQG